MEKVAGFWNNAQLIYLKLFKKYWDYIQKFEKDLIERIEYSNECL